MSVEVPTATDLPARLEQLQRELADLAFLLERSGRQDAADLANQLRSRLAAVMTDAPGNARNFSSLLDEFA